MPDSSIIVQQGRRIESVNLQPVPIRAMPAYFLKINPVFSIKGDALCFQKLALEGAAGDGTARANFALAIDYSLPGYVSVKG